MRAIEFDSDDQNRTGSLLTPPTHGQPLVIDYAQIAQMPANAPPVLVVPEQVTPVDEPASLLVAIASQPHATLQYLKTGFKLKKNDGFRVGIRVV